MFHIRDYLLPHNHAAQTRGRLAEHLRLRSCDCHCQCTPSQPSPSSTHSEEGGEKNATDTFLLGVTQGSTINISSQGVYIGTRASKTSGGGGADSADTTAESTTQVGPNRILAAWDADGLALERIDTLGNVPDPQANETMTVAYDTPHAALRFKIRDRFGELKTMVLGAPMLSVVSVPIRPCSDIAHALAADVVPYHSPGGLVMTALRTPAEGSAAFTVLLHGVPPWATEATFGFEWMLGAPPAVDTVWKVSVDLAANVRCSGRLRMGSHQTHASVDFIESTHVFMECADGERRPRCGADFGTACVETLTVNVVIGPEGYRGPLYIIGMRLLLHPY